MQLSDWIQLASEMPSLLHEFLEDVWDLVHLLGEERLPLAKQSSPPKSEYSNFGRPTHWAEVLPFADPRPGVGPRAAWLSYLHEAWRNMWGPNGPAETCEPWFAADYAPLLHPSGWTGRVGTS